MFWITFGRLKIGARLSYPIHFMVLAPRDVPAKRRGRRLRLRNAARQSARLHGKVASGIVLRYHARVTHSASGIQIGS